MNETDAFPRNEDPKLRAENEALRKEVFALRQFIDCMQNLTDAVEVQHSDTEVMDLLEHVLENTLQTINAKDGSLLVLDEDTEELVFILSKGEVPHEQLAWRRLPPGEGIAGWVVQHRRATIVNDAHEDDRFYSEVDNEFAFRTQSLLAAPLIGGGKVLGVVEALNKVGGNLFSTGDQTLLTLMCRFAGELLYTMIQKSESGQAPTRNPTLS